MSEKNHSQRPPLRERLKTKLGPTSEQKETLVNIPQGYRGPGLIVIGDLRIPVDIRVDHGTKPDDVDERRHFSVELRLGNGFNNRVEGPVPDEYLCATASDIERFLESGQEDLSNQS